MINNMVNYKRIKDMTNFIKDDIDFDNFMDYIYDGVYDFINEMSNTDEYKRMIENKFINYNNAENDNIDIDKIVVYFQNNPIGLYKSVLEMASFVKNRYEKTNELTIINKLKYCKFRSRCNDKIKLITEDYNIKFENGYFNKEEN